VTLRTVGSATVTSGGFTGTVVGVGRAQPASEERATMTGRKARLMEGFAGRESGTTHFTKSGRDPFGENRPITG
jgi:hypothetical protein